VRTRLWVLIGAAMSMISVGRVEEGWPPAAAPWNSPARCRSTGRSLLLLHTAESPAAVSRT